MGKIAFVYPGQGSQKVGMGLDLYENAEIKMLMDNIFDSIDNKELKDIMFNGRKKN